MATQVIDGYLDGVELISQLYNTDFSSVYSALQATGQDNVYDQYRIIMQQISQAEGVANPVYDSPGYNMGLNSNGGVTDYSYRMGGQVQTNTAASALDSNMQTASSGSASIPMSTVYEDPSSPISGVEVQNGARTAPAASVGSKVMAVADKIALGVVGVSVGAKCGAHLSQALYDTFPDFWNTIAPGGDPSNWDELATILPETMQQPARAAINALFGIDDVTKSSTMYLPTDAVAYFTMLMQQQGFFNTGGDGYEDDDINISPLTQPVGLCSHVYGYNQNGSVSIEVEILDRGTAYCYWGSNRWNCTIVCANTTGSTDTISHRWRTYNSSTGLWSDWINSYYKSTTSQGRTYYYDSANLNFGTYYPKPPVGVYQNAGTTNISAPEYAQKIYLILAFGDHVGGDLPDGVSHQPGATLPNLTNSDNMNAVDQKLRQQYPDWYQNPIYLPTQQPDGSIKDVQYIPIPSIPNPTNSDNPTNETVNQDADPTINPETSPQSLIDTIFRYLNLNPTNTDTPVEPDTGDGTSPTIITPTGEASTLFKIYNPTQAELDAFGAWLWSSNFVEQIKKLFNDPMQSIVGIHKVFATPSVGGSTTIHVGYLDSGVTSDWVDEQYTYVDCGTVNLYEVFGNVFDYSPFTTVRIYLPFIGIIPLDVADVMRSSINVRYGVDVLTGKCLAMVKITRDGNAGGVLYQYEGSCICRYPYSSGSYMGIVTSVLGAAMAVGLSGGPGMAVLGATNSIVNNFRTNVQQGGTFSGESGAMGGKIPYLIVSRPQPTVADRVERFMGWPANYTATLSDASGFVKVTSCHVETVANATDIEKREIENWLKSGVVIA